MKYSCSNASFAVILLSGFNVNSLSIKSSVTESRLFLIRQKFPNNPLTMVFVLRNDF